MRFQVTSKLIRPNSWITQTVRQRIPNCWARNGESTSAESMGTWPANPWDHKDRPDKQKTRVYKEFIYYITQHFIDFRLDCCQPMKQTLVSIDDT